MISIILPDHNSKRIQEVHEAIPYLPFNCEVVVAHDPDGDGKGAAIREGLRVSHGDIVCFLDSDMDIAPKMLNRLLPFLEDYNVVVGTKSIEYMPFSRKVLTVLSRLYIRIMFGIRVDSQTGIKIFRREVIPAWYSNGFGYDIEVLAIVSKKHRIAEVPIEAKVTKRMSLKAIWKTLKESIKIWFRL